MNYRVLFSFTMLVSMHAMNSIAADSLAIQENSPGICTMDGVVENDAAGYTGDGYINADAGVQTGVSWSFNVPVEGEYLFMWRYALGGGDITSRDGGLYVNNILLDTVLFPHSGSSDWSVWLFSDTIRAHLVAGLNTIRLGATTAKGLSNIDYFVIYGSGLEAAECLPAFSFSVSSNDPSKGSVSFSPEQALYDEGTEITVTATPNPGFFFHSWSGVESDTSAVFTFPISQKTDLTALFYEDGAIADPEASGYASIQHDNGTPYLLNGGGSGETVEPETLEELEVYLSSDAPLVIELSRHFTGTGEISVKSNKTLIGITDSAHIEGVKLSVADSRNIIIRDVTFSKVVTYDEIEINRSQNIWIDRCEFFTDREHDKDYYDGLLDIKNASSFITVSRSNFHDHFKAILISSGDDSYQDSVQRITFHHNYFHDCGSRLPSIRFGKAHLFSNFFENNQDAIHTRVGACVKVEHNYFRTVNGAVTTTQGFADFNPETNIFENSTYAQNIPECELQVPYPYEHLIEETNDLPSLIPSIVRVFEPQPSSITDKARSQTNLYVFPNPAQNELFLSPHLDIISRITVTVYAPTGQVMLRRQLKQGERKLNIGNLPSGIYMLLVQTDNHTSTTRFIKE